MQTLFAILLIALNIGAISYKFIALRLSTIQKYQMNHYAPLSQAEIVKLRRWSKRNIILVVSYWIILFLICFLATLLNWPNDSVIFALVILVFAVIYNVFSAQCPRCGLRLFTQLAFGFSVPKKCARCGVTLNGGYNDRQASDPPTG